MPIGLIIFMNGSVFIAVAVNLIWSAKTSTELRETKFDQTQAYATKRPRSGKTTSSKATSSFTKKATCNRLTTAIFSCFIVLGLTWLFGFLAINQVKIAFSYIFCFFNSIQGFLVLIAYILMSKPKRQMWIKKFKDIRNNLSNKAIEFDSGSYQNHVLNAARFNKLMKKKDIRYPNAVSSDSFNKNSVTSTPKPRAGVNPANKHLVTREIIRNTNSNESTSSLPFEEMIKNDLEIRNFIEKKKSLFSFITSGSKVDVPREKSSQKNVLSSNKHLMEFNIDKQRSNVNKFTHPELLESFSAENNAFRTALGFAAIVPTPIMSAKNRKTKENTTTVRDSIGHRSRVNSTQSTNVGFDETMRTITPSGVSVKMDMPGFVSNEDKR